MAGLVEGLKHEWFFPARQEAWVGPKAPKRPEAAANNDCPAAARRMLRLSGTQHLQHPQRPSAPSAPQHAHTHAATASSERRARPVRYWMATGGRLMLSNHDWRAGARGGRAANQAPGGPRPPLRGNAQPCRKSNPPPLARECSSNTLEHARVPLESRPHVDKTGGFGHSAGVAARWRRHDWRACTSVRPEARLLMLRARVGDSRDHHVGVCRAAWP